MIVSLTYYYTVFNLHTHTHESYYEYQYCPWLVICVNCNIVIVMEMNGEDESIEWRSSLNSIFSDWKDDRYMDNSD